MSLFDNSSDVEEDVTITVNEGYAKKFQEKKQREELDRRMCDDASFWVEGL